MVNRTGHRAALGSSRLLRLPDGPARPSAMADTVARSAAAAIARSGRFVFAMSPAVLTPAVADELAVAVPRQLWRVAHLFLADTLVPHHRRAETIARLRSLPVPATGRHACDVLGISALNGARQQELALRLLFQLEDGALPQFDLILLAESSGCLAAALADEGPAAGEVCRLAVAAFLPGSRAHYATLSPAVLGAARAMLIVAPVHTGNAIPAYA